MNSQVLDYRGLHKWVESQLGKPLKCEECGVTGDRGRKRPYHWANVSGEYKQDIKDWQRLCVPCHARKDKWGFQVGNHDPRPLRRLKFCNRGHKLDPSNLYIRTVSGRRECRGCRAIHGKNYRDRQAQKTPKDKQEKK